MHQHLLHGLPPHLSVLCHLDGIVELHMHFFAVLLDCMHPPFLLPALPSRSLHLPIECHIWVSFCVHSGNMTKIFQPSLLNSLVDVFLPIQLTANLCISDSISFVTPSIFLRQAILKTFNLFCCCFDHPYFRVLEQSTDDHDLKHFCLQSLA